MSRTDELFSEENMLAYSGACLRLAERVPEVMVSRNIDTLVIPSRGAVPLFMGMTYALPPLGSLSEEHDRFYSSLEVQKMLMSFMPEGAGTKRRGHQDNIRVLLAPFTADLNVNKYDPSQDNDEYTKKTREYWANVTAAFFQNPAERLRNPYFKSFVDVTLRDIEDRDALAMEYIHFPRINKFAMIDTVISGRAASDISNAFDTISTECENPDLVPYLFLVVDQNGERLRQPFAFSLKRRELSGKAGMFYVPNIVSEDKGAALLGVCATIYPSIMKASKGLELRVTPESEGKEFFVGAGSWHLARDLGPKNLYIETFEKFMELLYKGIDVKINDEYFGGTDSHDYGTALKDFKEMREAFVQSVRGSKVLSTVDADTSILPLNRKLVLDDRGSYETSSRVVHIPFTMQSTDAVMHRLHSLPNVYSRQPGKD